MNETDLEAGIRELTLPINGQYPRPWMTDMIDPGHARVFLVGLNQASGYAVTSLTHERHINALFNRNGESCRRLYLDLNEDRETPTRINMDAFVARLGRRGVEDVLQTNVVCYSTPRAKHIKCSINFGGEQVGEELFRFLLDAIRPAVVVTHGVETRKRLAATLCIDLAPIPTAGDELIAKTTTGSGYAPTVYVLPTLSPPVCNRKSMRWVPAYCDRVADDVAAELRYDQRFERSVQAND